VSSTRWLAWEPCISKGTLVSIDQHTVEDFASNGFLQTENPDMAPFAAMLQRG